MLVILVELADDLLCFPLRQLNQQTFVSLDVEGGDEQVALVGRDLNEVVALAELLRSLVQHHSVLVEVLCLLDDWVGALGTS